MPCDFAGWATKNDLKCSDGRIIRSNAFKVNDGTRVPLVWNHQYDAPEKILGHADLSNKPEGVWAECTFNNTPSASHAKEALKNGDICALSICANNLQQVGCEVQHGVIREVSIVLAGANPGAFIESVMAHGMPMEDGDDEGIFYTNEPLVIYHADSPKKEDVGGEENIHDENGETVTDVLNTLNEKQKKAVAIVIGQAIKEGDKDGSDNKKEGGKAMKHNVFSDGVVVNNPVLSHADMITILNDAKKNGSLKETIKRHLQTGGVLAHALDLSGMDQAKGTQTYGINDVDMLFPDYKTLTEKPEFISREMDWVQKVMNGVHHTPFSRIRSLYANITEDEARAKGYIKGKQKKTEVFTLLKRTTDPQTVYKLQKLDRDDIIDITTFDVVAWIKAEMRMMLDEEIARAILIGDGREADADDKIKQDHIRPIAHDVPLYNIRTAVKVSKDATLGEIASLTIDELVRARKHYKGSGNPKFFTTEDVLTEMLLLKDNNGHRLYKTETELATAIRVSEIVTVEPMSDQTVEIGGTSMPLIGIVVNLADYNVGADKGGEVSMFDDFDIDFNKYTYLIETRISGALIKPFSALTFGLSKPASKPEAPSENGEGDN